MEERERDIYIYYDIWGLWGFTWFVRTEFICIGVEPEV